MARRIRAALLGAMLLATLVGTGTNAAAPVVGISVSMWTYLPATPGYTTTGLPARITNVGDIPLRVTMTVRDNVGGPSVGVAYLSPTSFDLPAKKTCMVAMKVTVPTSVTLATPARAWVTATGKQIGTTLQGTGVLTAPAVGMGFQTGSPTPDKFGASTYQPNEAGYPGVGATQGRDQYDNPINGVLCGTTIDIRTPTLGGPGLTANATGPIAIALRNSSPADLTVTMSNKPSNLRWLPNAPLPAVTFAQTRFKVPAGTTCVVQARITSLPIGAAGSFEMAVKSPVGPLGITTVHRTTWNVEQGASPAPGPGSTPLCRAG